MGNLLPNDLFNILFGVQGDRQKPPVPELPKTVEELNNLLKKNIEVLYETAPVSDQGGEYRPGGVA